MNLSDVIRPNLDNIVVAAAAVVDAAGLPHYMSLDPQGVKLRLRELAEAMLKSVETGEPVHFASHAQSIAHDRFLAGVHIEELLTTFNALETALWENVVKVAPTEDVVADLGLIGSIIGAGKDQVASSYVEMATQRHTHGLDMSHLHEAL